MNTPHRDHASFLLRLWRNDSTHWLASIEDTATGERKGFANMELLVSFLMSVTDEAESDGEQNEPDAYDIPNP